MDRYLEKYLSQETTLVLLGAVFTHVIFNRFEPYRPLIWLLLFLASPLAILQGLHLPYNALPLLILEHLATLTLSVVLYRLSPLHPLWHIPGPISLKFSNLVIAYHSVRGKRHDYMEKLHRRYGKIVRIGCDNVSFADAEAAKICMGNKGLPRAAGYATAETLDTPGSIMTSYAAFYPNPTQVHHERRARWALAFTSKAIRDCDKFLLPRVERLLRKIGEQPGTLDLGKWLGYFTFDFMGDLFFDGGFDMLNDQDAGGYWKIIEDFAPAIASLFYLPWLTPVMLALPGADDAPINKFFRFSIKCVDGRLAKGNAIKDVFYYIAGEHIEDETKPKPTRAVIDSDVQTGIIGGSDTTASGMSNTIFCLLTHPDKLAKLRHEIDKTFGEEGVDLNDSVKLAELPYLNACINETLRVYPPVQTRISRGIPRGYGGIHVAGVYLPETTSMDFPPRVIHRDPDYFSPSPDSWLPERWLPDAEAQLGQPVIHNLDGFMPFSLGPANCVGRNLAMREMRLVIAQLIYKYDVQPAEKNPELFKKQWLDGLQDHQILLKGPLNVTLTRRVHA
ncbi:High nitrogen upregulated cytochrome P450 monooxygenase 2 [Mycena sanguinolenta]|uniref:High nitrogen upregulated cytochrome P450 monooxygenase 2 n=1 Tax=Mycena sanguinolenta TaxID=230812 RepID=A0A8H7CWZ0_9AGAR|nr:High nitrogen upregulated cytochrome P450 monooxygenase 2 [Mycena sanguinolenta]